MTTNFAAFWTAQPGPLAVWLRSGACWLLASAVGTVAAQNLGPAELAAKALASAPVQAVVNAKAPTAAGNTRQEAVQAQNDAQLEAIRQAILDATLERPTRVISSAWVDDKGALHESAHFHSEAQVRGVRILSYVQGDEPQTRVSAEVLPWGWRAAGADNGCAAAPRPWRLPLQVHSLRPDGFSGAQQFASQTILGLAQQSWTQHLQSSQRWRAHAQSSAWDPSDPLASGEAYLRVLTGQTTEHSGWTAELSLLPHAPEVQRTWSDRLSLGPAQPLWHWTLSLRLGQRDSPAAPMAVQWQVSQVLSVSPSHMANNPSAWAQRMQGQLQAQLHSWVAQLDKHTECAPIQFHVRRQGAQELQLQAGADSGLRPGDRVLLIHPSQVPSRMLEAGIAQHLALAEVISVGPRSAALQALAGPALSSPGPWLALPL